MATLRRREARLTGQAAPRLCQSAGAAIFAAFHIRLAADYVAQVLPPGAERDPVLVRSASAQVLVGGLQRPGPRRDLLVAGAFRAAVLDLRDRNAARIGDCHYLL